MQASSVGERTLTELDFARLSKLLEREHSSQLSDELADVLAYAEITSSREVAADVVTMRSRVELMDVHTREHHTLTICYPADAAPAAGYVSVFSPVGSSLLGLKAGDIARWQTPTGEEGAAEVTAIAFQPEATGDYLT